VIDFRYHLVSIIAIFLALAIGIVIGTAALNGPVTSALQKGNASLSDELANAHAQNAALDQQLNGAGTFAQQAGPLLLAHLLDAQRAVLIEAPGSPSAVDSGVIAALHQAGATISGQVQLQDKFFDTSATTAAAMDGISQGIKPASLTLTGSTAQQRAAQVLASALVTKAAPGPVDASSQAVLAGFAGPGFLTFSGQPAARATLAVVITPADPLTGPNASLTNQSLTDVAAAVSSASLAAVMAGPQSSTQAGGAIAALRASDSANQISSVDDADLAFGQIVTVQVLAKQLDAHSPGSYGTGPGATQVAPSPMPTATATATAAAATSPTPASPHAKKGAAR
jgi:Copper transport outer membrane protein, MctB